MLETILDIPPFNCMPGKVKARILSYLNPPVYPKMLQIEPTQRCNLKCVMCSHWQGKYNPKPDMTLDMFKKIVSQFPQALETINIQGVGEPLLNKDLIGMIEFARARGLETRFNTNMTLMTDKMAERLIKCGHSEVQFSIETVDSKLYSEIRRGTNLDKVLRNLDKLIEAKKRLNSEIPYIVVHAILMKILLPKIPKLLTVLKNKGVNHVHFADLFLHSGSEIILSDGSTVNENSLPVTMTDGEIIEVMKRIREFENTDFKISLPLEWEGEKIYSIHGSGIMTCAELWETPFVTCDGYMTPCCWETDPSTFNVGNFNEMTFDEIWFGAEYEKLRSQHLENAHPYMCARCRQLVQVFVHPSCFRGNHSNEHRYRKCFLGRSRFSLK